MEMRKQEMEFELRKMELRAENQKLNPEERNGKNITVNAMSELSKSMPKFDTKSCDIILYLSLFEKQVQRFKIEDKDWVSSLLSLMPPDIVELIARIPDEKFEDYQYVKDVLLKRFQLSAEGFRQKFVQHQRSAEKTWKDFVYEVTNYFEGWLDGLNVKDFKGLKDLIITDQVKRRVPYEIRDHFVDNWSQMMKPEELADKIDEYESVRRVFKRQSNSNQKPGNGEYHKNLTKNAPPDNKRSFMKPQAVAGKLRPKFVCFSCGKEGHTRKSCTEFSKAKTDQDTKRKANVNNAHANLVDEKPKEVVDTSVLTARITVPVEAIANIDTLKTVNIKCGKNTLKGIIDTGAQISVVRSDLIDWDDGEGEGKMEIKSAFGESEIVPLKICNMKIADGRHANVPIMCAISRKLVSDMLICQTAYEALMDSIQLSSLETHLISDDKREEVRINGVGAENALTGHETSDAPKENENRSSFIKLQREDETLKDVWELAEGCRHDYEVKDGILVHNDNVCGEQVQQIVLPLCKRDCVMKVGHDIPLAGHLGEAKTKQRIKYSFFWPTLKKDVKKYCESCKECQLRRTVTYRDRIPIQPIFRPETPFEVWSVDCIGPLEPPSGRGHKFIVCAVDMCTRWAEAIPAKNISAKTTCDILMGIFTRTGFPKTVCTDQGSNFTSQLTRAFLDVIGAAPRFATPGHPESMGVVERWNRTLKDMMNKNIQENGRNWDLHLPFLLFAYREVPHSTTGISPFQLVYGRLPPGPLSVIKNHWIGEKDLPLNASRSVEEYIEVLQDKIKKAHSLAKDNSIKSQANYTNRYNLRSKEKVFEEGDQVLILQPSSTHKLLKTWIGPVTIKRLTRPHSVLVELEDGSRRELHVNKVRPYIARVNHIGVVFDQDTDFGDLYYAPNDKRQASFKDISDLVRGMKDRLNDNQRHELQEILCKYIDVFSDKPGRAKVDGHSIKVTPDCTPRRLPPYRVPIALREEVDRQVKELLELGLIEPSDSDWSHPIVCVSKKDGTVRLCVDYRLLNSFTVPNAYPMKNATELLYEIGKAKFITVMDLTKGYWQIPMEEGSKSFTAFVTHSGHYQWRVLPFGLKNAGSTFQKSLDKLLFPYRNFCRSYIDDVAIYSDTWIDHLHHLEQVLKTFSAAGLTVNEKKCTFAKDEVRYLGHIIGSGRHAPDPQKTETMVHLESPTTKKELRSVLGLASYYRDYIPDYSHLVLPLTNLTKKRVPNKIPWGEAEERTFQSLKRQLIKMPSLYTPIPGKPFQLYTDASATAVGACLSQDDVEGREHPIAFYSKKLTPCQTRWSTIEREAYSVLAALKRFDTWIFGAQVQIISDHNPLTYLTRGLPQGAKLARWALALQRYNMTISYRKGSRHGNADALSRLPIRDT